MKQTFLYFFLFCKRLLKKPVFVILLLLLPIMSIFLKKAFTIQSVHIRTALYTSDKVGISANAVEMLINQNDIIEFVECESPDEVRTMVASGECVCGYILPESLEEKFDLNLFRNSIDVLTGSYSVSPLTDEMVFSAVYRYYALHILDKYIDDTGLFKKYSSKEIKNELSDLYNKYLIDGSTFSFNYHNENAISKDSSVLLPGFLILSVRGLLSVIIFISGFAGAVQLYRDRSNCIFRTLSGIRLRLAEFMVILSPVTIMGVSCLISLAVSGSTGNIFKEISSIAFYIFCVTIFCYILCIIFKNEVSLCALIPVFIMASLIICPIFIDITEFNGKFGILQQIFPPTWYLNFFN